MLKELKPALTSIESFGELGLCQHFLRRRKCSRPELSAVENGFDVTRAADGPDLRLQSLAVFHALKPALVSMSFGIAAPSALRTIDRVLNGFGVKGASASHSLERVLNGFGVQGDTTRRGFERIFFSVGVAVIAAGQGLERVDLDRVFSSVSVTGTAANPTFE
jgi:hypothetical protein